MNDLIVRDKAIDGDVNYLKELSLDELGGLADNAWQSSVRGILATSFICGEAHARFGVKRGRPTKRDVDNALITNGWKEWAAKRSFGVRTAEMLVEIANSERIAQIITKHASDLSSLSLRDANLDMLPPSWYTIYLLTRLSDDQWDDGLATGTIHPGMARKNAIALLHSKKETETPPLPEGKYNVIYADPPWDVRAGPDWGSGGDSHDLEYPTMGVEEIKELPIKELAADNAHLYLWTINKYILESYEVARAWGFEPSCLLTWVKPPHGIGLGGTYIQTTEHLLFARRGVWEATKRVDTTWFQYPRGWHSEKPAGFRKMIEDVSPGKRIELFAREEIDGWDVWGNEVCGGNN